MVVVVLLVLSSTLLIPLSCLSLPLQFRFLLETTQHNPSQTPKMQLTTLLGAVALLATSAIASPLVTRAPAHNPATADVTDFHAVRNGTHILYYPPPPPTQPPFPSNTQLTPSLTSYTATIQLPEDTPPAKFTHATLGYKVPELSSMWDSSDPALYFRFLRVPSSTGGEDRLRFVLSDVHKTGSTVNLDYFSPVAEWEGRGRVVYTGREKFVLKV